MRTEKPTLYQVENAFQPAKEINDIERFAGRARPVSDAFLGLMAEGANLAIVGNRGIGKTSLARQVQNFGRGDNGLIHKLALNYDHLFDFHVMYLACGTDINTCDELLSRLLTSDTCLGNWLYDIPKTKKMIHSLAPKLAARLFGVSAELGTTQSDEETHEVVPVPQTVGGVFENVIRNFVDEGMTKDGVLIVIDEFDQISDPSGIGPFFESFGHEYKKSQILHCWGC